MIKKILQSATVLVLIVSLFLPFQSFAATAGTTTKKPVELKDGKTYSKYDIDGDGKADKIKVVYTHESGEGFASIYLKGKLVQKISLIRGGSVHLMAPSAKKVFLLMEKGQFGANIMDAYKYSGKKFKCVYSNLGESVLDYVVPYSNSSSLISVKCMNGKHNQNIFSTEGKGISFRVKYKIDGSKLSLKTRICPIIGNKTFTAVKAFKTSSAYSKVNKKGVSVKAGQTVKVTKVRLIKKDGLFSAAYLIDVNGKTGWILESQFTTPFDPILE